MGAGQGGVGGKPIHVKLPTALTLGEARRRAGMAESDAQHGEEFPIRQQAGCPAPLSLPHVHQKDSGLPVEVGSQSEYICSWHPPHPKGHPVTLMRSPPHTIILELNVDATPAKTSLLPDWIRGASAPLETSFLCQGNLSQKRHFIMHLS